MIIYKGQPMESIYDFYPKISPLNAKLLSPRRPKQKLDRQPSTHKVAKVSRKSLVNQYSTLCKRHSIKDLPELQFDARNRHTLFGEREGEGGLKEEGGQREAENKTIKSQRVENTISLLNQYSQECKGALASQYKSRRKVGPHQGKRSSEDFMSQQNIPGQNRENPEMNATRTMSSSKYANKSMAFKTINILYRAIIDSSMQGSKKKEEFEVQANRLPILDRFNATKRSNKFRDSPSPSAEKTGNIMTLDPRGVSKVDMNRTARRQQQKQRSEEVFGRRGEERVIQGEGVAGPKIVRGKDMAGRWEEGLADRGRPGLTGRGSGLREDVDIFPWSIEEEQLPC